MGADRLARHFLAGTSLLALLAASPARAAATGPIDTGPGTFTGDFVNSGSTPGVFISNTAVVDGNIVNPAGAAFSPGIAHPGLKGISNFTYLGIGVLGSTLNGGITNAGLISVSAATNGGVLAGIALHPLITKIVGVSSFLGSSASLAGAIVNSGTIVVSAHQGGGALGVYDAANAGGSGFTNTGLIVVTGTGAGAGGVQLDQFTSTPGYIFNSGTMSVTGTSSGGAFTDVKGNFIGFTNSGQITVSDASASSVVFGLHLDSSVTLAQGVTNSGLIQVISSGTAKSGFAGPDVQAIELIGGGIGLIGNKVNFDQTMAGSVVNSGTMLALNAATSGGATGINIFDGVTILGGVTNSGLLSVSAAGGLFTPTIGTPFTAGAIGIVIGGQADTPISMGLAPVISGAVSNNGVIAVSSAIGPAQGIEITGVVTLLGGISNSGTILANGIQASGILVKGASLGGGVSNSGLIAAANGIVVQQGTIAGNIVNSGKIGSGPAPTNNGIILGLGSVLQAGAGGDGSIVNAGTIIAVISADAVHISSATLAGGVTNRGVLAFGGLRSTGIQVTATASGSTSLGGTIRNIGTISGNGIGIEVNGNLPGTVTAAAIVNSGTIAAQTGIAIAGSVNLAGGIVNTGTIIGTTAAIDLSGATNPTTISQQAGLLQGTIHLSSHSDTFTIAGGTVSGSIDPPATSGTVNLSGGSLILAPANSVSGIAQFNQSAGGLLVMQVTPNTAVHPSVSALSIGISPGSVLQVAPLASAGAFQRRQTYLDVVQSGSPFANNFAVTTTSPLFTASLVPDAATPNALDLLLNATAFCALPGLSRNQLAAGCRLDALAQTATDAATTAFLKSLGALDLGTLRGALSELAGSQHPQTYHMALVGAENAMALVQSHIGAGGTQGGLGGFGLTRDGLRFAALDGPVADAGPMPAREAGNGGYWATAYGGLADASDTSDALGFSAGTGGAAAGVDVNLGGGVTLGGALDYSHTRLSFDQGGGSSNIDAYLFLPYARWSAGQFYVSGLGAVGLNDFTTSRAIAFPGFAANAQSTHTGAIYGAAAESGMGFAFGNLTATPAARVQYTRLEAKAFSETSGGAAALAVNAATAQSLESALGGRVAARLDMGLTPEAHAYWQHEFLTDRQKVGASFLGAPAGQFAMVSSRFGRDGGLLGLALTGEPAPNVALSLSYDAEVSSGLTSHVFAAGARVRF